MGEKIKLKFISNRKQPVRFTQFIYLFNPLEDLKKMNEKMTESPILAGTMTHRSMTNQRRMYKNEFRLVETDKNSQNFFIRFYFHFAQPKFQ